MNTFRIAEEDKEKYIEEAFRNNRFLCMVAAVFCIAIEAFNTVRVLFLSNSGLSTLNNRIYFGFYVFLLAASVLYFFFVSMLGKKPDTGNAVCLVYAGIVLLWNTCLNVYDIVRSSRVHVIMAVTMMITFAAIVTARPVYTLINIWINYFIFMMVSSIPLFSGEGFNYTITALISSMISLVGYRRLCIELEQRRQIREIGQKLDERRMWLTREQYELISQNAGFITFQWEPETDRIVFSKNWTEIFEHHNVIPGFLSFVDNSTLIEQEQKRRIRCCIEEIQTGPGYQNLELLLPVKGHIQRWFKVQIVRQSLSSDDQTMCAVGFMNDITEEKERMLNLEKEAAVDSFTGLMNKASIDAYGRNWLRSLSRKGQRLAMLVLDMDDFKNINDTYGHPCGDYVLKQTAELLTEFAPENSKTGRLGGDEFLVLTAVREDESHISKYAEMIVRNVQRIWWNGEDIHVSISIGYAVTEPGWSYEKLYKCADEALYTAKKNGKNRVWRYQE